jgi:hypothetical protein
MRFTRGKEPRKYQIGKVELFKKKIYSHIRMKIVHLLQIPCLIGIVLWKMSKIEFKNTRKRSQDLCMGRRGL